MGPIAKIDPFGVDHYKLGTMIVDGTTHEGGYDRVV